jgi:hypothetical protein
MLIEKRDNTEWADIYWDDLSATAQAKLSDLIGGNGNYDTFPIASINVGKEGGLNEVSLQSDRS